MKPVLPPRSCLLKECQNTTSSKETGHPLGDYCTRCRAIIMRHARGESDYTKGIEHLWGSKHLCSWCGKNKAVGPDEDKDPICDVCRALPGPYDVRLDDASLLMEATCQAV